MYVKKAGGKIFGADLTAAEKKALKIELGKAMAEFDRKNLIEIDALMLWWLHEKLGFGVKRLREFYVGFNQAFEGMIQHYEMGELDGSWLCTEKLKTIGVDLEEWAKEDLSKDAETQ